MSLSEFIHHCSLSLGSLSVCLSSRRSSTWNMEWLPVCLHRTLHHHHRHHHHHRYHPNHLHHNCGASILFRSQRVERIQSRDRSLCDQYHWGQKSGRFLVLVRPLDQFEPDFGTFASNCELCKCRE